MPDPTPTARDDDGQTWIVESGRRVVCGLCLQPMPLKIPARDYLAGLQQFCARCALVVGVNNHVPLA